MAKVDEIIIEVEVNAGESAEKLAEVKNKMADLKAEQKALNATIKENGTVTAEQAQRLAQISGELKTLGQEERMYTAQLNTATDGNKEFGKSLAALGAELTKMKSEYRNMSKEMRDSDAGKALQKSIVELDKTMKDADASLGDHQRNVGNYQSALLGLNGNVLKVAQLFQGGFRNGLAAATTALKSFAKTLLTTPIGWIAAAVMAAKKVFDELRDAFKRNDEAGTALQVALARFQPIITGIRKVFEGLAKVVAGIVDVFTKAATAVLNLIPAYREASKAAQDLVKAQDELEERQRQTAVKQAERNKRIAELNKQARGDEKLNAKEREEIYKEIDELSRQNMEDEVKLREQEYNDYVQWMEQQRDLDDEALNEKNRLYIAMIQAQTEYLNETTRNSSREAQARKEQAAQERKELEDRRRRYEECQKARVEAAKKAQDELRKLEDLQTAMIEDEGERTRAAIRQNYTRQTEDLKARLETEKNLTAEARESISGQIVLLEQQMWKELAEVDERELQARADAVSDMSAKAAEKAAKAAEEAEKATSDERARIRAEYERDALEIANEYQAKLNAIYGNATEQAELEAERTATFYRSLVTMDAETKAAMFESEEQYEAAVLAAEQEMYEARTRSENALKQQADEIGATMQSVTGALSELYEAAAGDSEAYEKFKKAMAIVDATISLATTIAAATAVSTEGDPYTMAIRIAANVAAVTAQFAAVIAAIKKATVPSAPAFAKGGIVPGTSYTGDRVTAAVNSREMVLTLQQQGHLFDMIQAGVPQGGIDYRRMAEAVAEGVAALPAPVLDYAEFTSFGRRVALQDRKLTQM